MLPCYSSQKLLLRSLAAHETIRRIVRPSCCSGSCSQPNYLDRTPWALTQSSSNTPALLSDSTSRTERLLQNEALERRRQENSAQRLRGAIRHLLADGENLDHADRYTRPTPGGERAEEHPGHETKLESSNRCSSSSSNVGTLEQTLRDGLAFGGGGAAARPRAAVDTRDCSRDSLQAADRLGHGVALGSGGGSDVVVGAAAVGD